MHDLRADELVFLDITATIRSKKTIVELVEKVAARVFIPFTVGGGISRADEIGLLLRSGADKCSINTAAVNNPDLLRESAERFGSQCVVLAIDARRTQNKDNHWHVCVKAGSEPTDLDAVQWAVQAQKLGAGEILLTSWDRDGTKSGYDLELIREVSAAVGVPVIASGGAADPGHMLAALRAGANAVLAASIFHYGEYNVSQLKKFLADEDIEVRP